MNLLKPRMKRQQLVNIFKEMLIDGSLCHGRQLPTYEELDRQFDASRATLNYVLTQLKHDGYVQSIERQGVFVSEHLPCRSRYALVFESEEHNLFWTKLIHEAQLINRSNNGCQFEIFHSDILQHEDSQRLLDLLARKMIAGVFFFFDPCNSLPRKIFTDYPDIPKIVTDKKRTQHNMYRVILNTESCVNKVIEYAKGHGIKKIGVISKGQQSLAEEFPEIAEKNHVCVKPEWVVAAPEKYIDGVRNLTRLLMALGPEKRPEALYITDDNLITPVQSTLIELGIKVPEDIRLICHFNFPDSTETVLPVKKIGYDVRDILKTGIAKIQCHYNGTTPETMTVTGKYDSEINV